MKNIATLITLLALAACGGGGGGGSAPSTPASSATGLSVTFNKSSLNFEYNEGDTAPAQLVLASATGNTDKDILMGAEVTGKGIQTPINVAVDVATRSATITVVPERGLAAGTYNGSIKMLACANQGCSVQHGGSPYTVNYTITVRAGLKPSAASLNLAAAETGASTISTFTFNPPAAGAQVTASVDYITGRIGWLNARVVGATVEVQAMAGAMAAGTYQANLVLSVAGTGQKATVPVTLTVGSELIVSENASVKVDSAAASQQLQGTVALALAPGATATTWSAGSSQAWLKLGSASGSFATPLTWTIDPAAFSALPNNAHHTAQILIRTNSNLPARLFTLDVHKVLAEIKGLDTLALLSGQSGDVLVYGQGFSALPAGVAGVSVQGVQPTAASVISDNVLRVTLPVMQAGTYALTLKSASGMTTPGKNLVVTGTGSYTYQALNTEGLKNTVVWDAVSKSAFVVNRTLKSVMRYAQVNGRFQLAATRSFPAVDSVAMTPDRNALVLQSGYNVIYKLSPTTLSTLDTFSLGEFGGSPSHYYTEPLTIMGDNRLMHPLWGWIDLDTGGKSPLLTDIQRYGYSPADWGVVAGNGLRMILPDSGLYSPHGPMSRIDLGVSGTLRAYNTAMTPFFYRAAANHDGSVWWLEGDVVDFNLNVRGFAKLPEGWASNHAVISRDGTRMYQYAQNSASATARVYVFDTSKALTTAVNLPVLGFIAMADVPNCPYDGSSFDANCGPFETRIAISDDGKALFIAGDRKFVVLPIPAAMAAANVRAGGSVLGGQTVIPAVRR